MTLTTRRDWLARAFAGSLAGSLASPMTGAFAANAAAAVPAPIPATPLAQAAAKSAGRPLRIYAITFRGMTDVERGFEEHFRSRKIAVQITYRDLNRDATRMPAFLDEIRATRPDLIYTWGTSVTLGVVGPHDAKDRSKYINDIPVVFTLVASATLAKIIPESGPARPNVTGVTHVAPTSAQIQAMASYRKFQTLGVLYTPTEKNSVVVIDQIRKLGRERGFDTVERMFRLDGNRQPTAEGASEIVRELKDAGAQWLYLPPDSYLGSLAQEVVIPAAMQVGLPTFASTEQLMQAGALTGLVCRYFSIGQYTAHKVEQVLVGKIAPAAIPVDTLKRFSLQLRMSAAERLHLPPPLTMLSYAELVGGETPG